MSARLARWIGPCLLLAFGLVLLPGLWRARESADADARLAQARQTLRTLAEAIADARRLGIPVDALTGLDTTAEPLLAPDDGLLDLRLIDADGHVHWTFRPAAAEVRLRVPLADGWALVSGYRPSPGLGAEHLADLADLGGWLLVLAVSALLLSELSRCLQARREGFVSELTDRVTDAMGRADFSATWRPAGTRDRALAALRDRTLGVQEAHAALRRLIDSMCRTEPDKDRRRRLRESLAEVEARFVFAAAPHVHRPRPPWRRRRGDSSTGATS